MQRIPEPELMNDAVQARAYAGADFSEPHSLFVTLFGEHFPDLSVSGTVLDLGCGPADISRRFASAYPDCHIHGIDGARHMLKLGREANVLAGLDDRIVLHELLLPGNRLPLEEYPIIISNSLLHHLHDPMVLWTTILDFAASGAAVFVMDLQRPPSPRVAREYVDKYAGKEPDVLREDFYASLCAAFTPGEIRGQLLEAGLPGFTVQAVSDRHVIVYGSMP